MKSILNNAGRLVASSSFIPVNLSEHFTQEELTILMNNPSITQEASLEVIEVIKEMIKEKMKPEETSVLEVRGIPSSKVGEVYSLLKSHYPEVEVEEYSEDSSDEVSNNEESNIDECDCSVCSSTITEDSEVDSQGQELDPRVAEALKFMGINPSKVVVLKTLK